MLKNHLRATLKRQTIAFVLTTAICVCISPALQAKGLFSDAEKGGQTADQLQAQLYQIQQQLTQLQAQMTQLNLQMSKRTTVIEQKQNSLHEILVQQGNALKNIAREEQQIEQQVHHAQTVRQPEPIAKAAPRVQPQVQPTLEESADYEVAKVNTKAAPAYKSHIQDLTPVETSVPKKAEVKPVVTTPVSVATKLPADKNSALNTVAEAKETKKSKKAEAAEKAEKEKAEREKADKLDEKADASNRMLPSVVGDKLAKAKKEGKDKSKKDAKDSKDAKEDLARVATQTQAAPAAASLNSGKPRVRASITIKAPPDVVWDAVHEQRKSDPELAYSKVLRQGVNEATLEQKFTVIPVIGSAVCVMNTKEVPNQRIDYQMVKSDRFKAMEGSWVLTPGADGKSTNLELSSHVDFGMFVPVPKSMRDSITKQKLERRLTHVRELAEKSRIAQKAGAQAQ